MQLFQVGLVACVLGFTSMAASAGEGSANSEIEQQIVDKLQQAVPGIPMVGIQKSPVAGLYEVILGNGERVFVAPDAGYFVAGELFQLTDKGLLNLTDAQRNLARAERLASIDPSDKITFSPEIKKASITVFTDVDCGYCQKLHREMTSYLEAGIEVSYLAYPRAGIGSSSYNKIVKAWCAEDRQDAMTRLKQGKQVDAASCENPVEEHYQLARELGIRGTPAIILESGKIISGYQPAPALVQLLGI